MKVLLVNKIFPSRTEIAEAANLVLFELAAGLAKTPEFEVGFLKIDFGQPSVEIDRHKKELGAIGVDVLDPLYVPFSGQEKKTFGQSIRSQIWPILTDFYGYAGYAPRLNEAVRRWGADAIVVAWCEVSTVLVAPVDVKVKYAYYGNPDPKTALARQEFQLRFGKSDWIARLKLAYFKYRLKALEKMHLSVLKHYDVVGDVAFNDVIYYRLKGLDHVFYVRNMWYTAQGDRFREFKEKREQVGNRIVGNVGRLNATANTYGLEILGRTVVPRLRQHLGRDQFEIHVLGSQQPVAQVKAILAAQSEVLFRGFVTDIDDEIQQAKVFLVTNNAGPFKVGHTRFLHAWSLGTCVVAHADAALSMPEIIHGHNALLARNESEIADLVVLALQDPALRNRLTENGYETFKRFFTAESVVPEIVNDLGRTYKEKQHAHGY